MKERNKSVSKRSKWLIIIGFLFFVNPIPAGLDLVPDVFGCGLIFLGLTQIAFFDGSIEEARKNMLWLFAIEFARLLLMKSVFLTNIGSNRLLAVTAFAILESIFGIFFFRKFFSGLSYYAMRRNCNETLAKCDGVAFLSYLAFFVRIGATLIPELLAIVELRLHTETDLKTLDMIEDIVSIRPVLIILLSLIALGISVFWYISLAKLVSVFHAESGEEMDIKYEAEYTSVPEQVLPKQFGRGAILMRIAFVFALDIAFDGIRILPSAAMYLIAFGALWFYREVCDFKKSKRFAIPATAMFLVCEVYARIYAPYGAVVIYETDITIVAIGAILGIIASICGLLFVRSLLTEANNLSKSLGGSELPTGVAWVFYILTLSLWIAGFAVPYFYSYISTARLICAVVFMLKASRVFSILQEEEELRASLMPR